MKCVHSNIRPQLWEPAGQTLESKQSYQSTTQTENAEITIIINQSINFLHSNLTSHSKTSDSTAVSHASPYGPLRPNTTSSIKLEVHNIVQRRQRRTEPRPQRICTKKFCEDRSSSPKDMLTDRQAHTHTHRQTDKLVAILHSHTGAE